MPRTRRWEFLGEIHHVMARGLEGRDIFIGDADRTKFLALLEKNLLRYGVGCLSFALMSNHYHLLLRPQDRKLGECLRALNGSYAQYFNRTQGRRGYLFQDRYKAVLSTGLQHTMETILYIHLNPIRAGLVRNVVELEKYRWCSHTELLKRNPPEWFDRDEVLAPFSHSVSVYRQELQARGGCDFGEEPRELLLRFSPATEDEQRGLPVAAAQSGLFAERRRILGKQADALGMRQANLRKRGITIDTLVHRAEALFRLPESSLMQRGRCRGRDTVRARSLICWCAYRDLGMSMVCIGEFFGITNGAVSRLVWRGEKLAKAEKLTLDEWE